MPTSWRTLRSRTLLQDRWIDLRADTCETGSGIPIDPYYVLRYPDWVHVVALTPARELVLVEQYRHGAGIVTLELPGGAADPADPGPAETGRRELREETGWDAGATRLVASLYPNPATQTNRIHTVLATDCRPAGPQSLDGGEEGMRVRVLPLATVLDGLAGGLLGQSMQVAGLLLALREAGA